MKSLESTLLFIDLILREKLIYVKGPWSKPRDKYITITIGPKELMNKFLDATKEFLKNY